MWWKIQYSDLILQHVATGDQDKSAGGRFNNLSSLESYFAMWSYPLFFRKYSSVFDEYEILSFPAGRRAQ